MTKKILSFMLFLVISSCYSHIFAQNRVSGVVTSDKGELLKSVRIQIENTSRSTLSDENGYFEFSNINGKKATLIFTSVGYSTRKEEFRIPVNGLTVILNAGNNLLEEVIIDSYIRKHTSTTNKMPLDFIENPQVFSSLDKSVLEDQLLFTIDDAYRNITGLQKMWNPSSRAGDGGSFINLRGFVSNNSLRNGLISPVTTTIDAINIEKVEVLKGPSATLYGSNITSYGGVVNRITKQPFDSLAGNITATAGGFNLYRVSADINAPLTNDKKLMFRVNTAYTNSGTFQKKDSKNEYLAFTPSLLYKVNERLDIRADFEIYNTQATPEQLFFGLTSIPSLGIYNMDDLGNVLGLDYRQSYLGDGLKMKSRVRNLFAQVNYKISDNIRSSTNFSNAYSFSDGFNPAFYIVPKSMFTQIPSDSEIGILRSDQSSDNSKRKFIQLQQNFNLDYSFGAVRNRTVAGFDYMRTKDEQLFVSTYFDWVPFKGMDYSGMNKTTLQKLYDNTPNPRLYYTTGNLNTYSGYISNVITPVKGLNFMTAIRYESNDFEGGMLALTPTKPYHQSVWSPKLGLVYEIISDKFSVFGNYQNSFKSNGYYLTDTAANTALSVPERANQLEGGFKMNLLQNRINASLSFYNIQVKNSLIYTGELTSNLQYVQSQAGKVTSKGVELELNAYLVKGFSIIGGLSYNDAKITENKINNSLVGTRPIDAGSKWLANFNINYKFLDGTMKGLGLGIGGNYASENNVTGTFILPQYFILNVNAAYDTKRYRIGIRGDNITNKRYWIGYQTANPQPLANLVGSLTFKF